MELASQKAGLCTAGYAALGCGPFSTSSAHCSLLELAFSRHHRAAPKAPRRSQSHSFAFVTHFRPQSLLFSAFFTLLSVSIDLDSTRDYVYTTISNLTLIPETPNTTTTTMQL